MTAMQAVLLGALVLATPLAAFAQGDCPAGTPDLLSTHEGAKISAPAGFDGAGATAQFLDAGAPVGDKVPGKAVGVDDEAVRTALNAGKTLTLQWTAGTRKCSVKVKSDGTQPPGRDTAPPAASTGGTLDECSRSTDAYERLIDRRLYGLVVFCGNGTVLDRSSRKNDIFVEGDPIYVGVYTNQDQTDINIEWPTCKPRDPTAKRFGSTNFGSIPTLTGRSAFSMTPATPTLYRQCFGDSVQVKVTSKASSTEIESLNRTETIQQYALYNYSLQLGATFTGDVSHDFDVTKDSTGVSRIRDKGPSGHGPKYFAALTIYGLPYQICSAFRGCGDKSPYYGRDLVNDQGFLDRISGVFGVGLDHPQNEFEAGLGFELMPGVNAIAVYRLAKIDVLDGVAAGDMFAGTAADIPTRSKWKGSFAAGIAFDLNYVMNWFGRK